MSVFGLCLVRIFPHSDTFHAVRADLEKVYLTGKFIIAKLGKMLEVAAFLKKTLSMGFFI